MKISMSCSCFSSSSKRRKSAPGSSNVIERHQLKDVTLISYSELKSATNNFHESSKIGRGGFGVVYQGTLRNGTQVAVKKLSAESKQGLNEFISEINSISNVTHQNLVQLIGCCVEGSNRILVYEFMENNSLDHALLGSVNTEIKLDWRQRSNICLGTAQGLAFLHEENMPHIVHRDIKASNILLDRDFNPKIGDFGLAKLFPDDITHIVTRIAGTKGYLAPEYALGGPLTLKADVYSFGVLVLEIVSGRRCAKYYSERAPKFLLEKAWELYKKGDLLRLVDPKLEGQYPEEEVLRYMKVAFFCTQSALNRRPPMSLVVKMLSRNIKLNEKELTAPGFFQDSTQSSGQSSSKKSSADSTRVMTSVPITITEVSPR